MSTQITIKTWFTNPKGAIQSDSAQFTSYSQAAKWLAAQRKRPGWGRRYGTEILPNAATARRVYFLAAAL